MFPEKKLLDDEEKKVEQEKETERSSRPEDIKSLGRLQGFPSNPCTRDTDTGEESTTCVTFFSSS